MDTREAITKELDELLANQQQLIDLTKETKDMVAFGTAYQNWYSRAYKLVQALAPERLAEFTGYYQIDTKRKVTDASNYVIQDYVKGIGARVGAYSKPLWDIHLTIQIRIVNQMQIIASLRSRIGTVLQDVTGHLFAELQDAELNAASQLKKTSLRAAGALAGVVLERHLQRVAVNHGVAPAKKSPTIADLNDPLKQAGVYDTPTWRKIQLLSDIRNICSHQKSADPTPEQVEELIAGVNSVVKGIF